MGYRVSPLEVEHCLARHPAVAEVAVAAIEVDEEISLIAAFVVPRDAEQANADSLLAHARRHLAQYKRPREIVFCDSLPRTPNGKLQRRRLAVHGRPTRR
jgi:acyl-coenzyme A synthetase/AMP-(fatty) acid ligase